MKKVYTHCEVGGLAVATATDILEFVNSGALPYAPRAYPIPRGGVPAAYAIKASMPQMNIVDRPEIADIFIDDIIDSGRTVERFGKAYPGKPFFALIDKRRHSRPEEWIIWPWEGGDESSIEDNVVRLLQYVGEDASRGGLHETPKRVAKAWKEWTSGYDVNPEDVLKCFEDGANGYDEMVIVKDTPFYSHCEHHLAAIFGTVTIAYIPKGRIVGLSKLARLADVYAHRLQVQERMTTQIADTLEKVLAPRGVGVVIKARHLCMESRGTNKQGQITITSALRGVLKDKPEARAEFLDLAR